MQSNLYKVVTLKEWLSDRLIQVDRLIHIKHNKSDIGNAPTRSQNHLLGKGKEKDL